MYELIKLNARIELFANKQARQTPFFSGYRPLFNFDRASTKISGRIDLHDIKEFAPGMSGTVTITFIKGMIKDSYFKVGERFSFDEGTSAILGEGVIQEIL